jgi:galactokinase
VTKVVDSLRAGGGVPGETLYESHESLRTQYECSTAELDWFVDRARGIKGVRGARLTGAGWGGCAIALGVRQALDDAQTELGHEYEAVFGRAPRVWLTHAARGAAIANPL